jgi:asparagine synthase (glutamine-hydrolysing)
MCGICGVIQVGGAPRPVLAPGVIDRMTDAMAHRGPSDRGTFEAEGVALGARRLSIIDVDGGHQPIASEDRLVWAVQNGELYNHEDIRNALRREGHRLVTRCDTEILPHLYERDGVALQESLTGKFAIAVWDGTRRRAVLSRDRLGIKPLYYAHTGDLVVFASELKSLLASGLVEGQLDHAALRDYLELGFVPGPRTPLLGVRKVMPAHRVIIDAHGVREEPYWRFPAPAPNEGLTEAEAGERLLTELEHAVRRRLMSDVPLGAMLSGGLDSSLIVALMARNMTEPVKTFSVGFAEAQEANELADAKLVSDAFGTEHHALELSLSEQAIGLEEFVWWLDEPLADLGALGFLALSQLAAKHVTVALAGQGADELLGGYGRYRRGYVVGGVKRLPAVLRAPTRAALKRMGGRCARLAEAIAAQNPVSCQTALNWSAWAHPDLYPDLALGRPTEGSAVRRAIEAHADGLGDDPLASSMYLDAQLSLVDDLIHYFDRASMARSLEIRLPFLDHHVVELCASIPNELKIRRLATKPLLKQVARGVVPDRVIDKPKVGFFYSATRDWMKSQLRGPGADYLLQDQLACGEVVNAAEVRRMATTQTDNRPTDLDALFPVLILEVWLRHVLPRALAAPEPVREQIRLSA